MKRYRSVELFGWRFEEQIDAHEDIVKRILLLGYRVLDIQIGFLDPHVASHKAGSSIFADVDG
jgi:hypothetical protein